MKYLDTFSEILEKFKLTDGNEFTALCPFHDDNNPSFSGNAENGLWMCHACDAKGNIFQFKERLNLSNDCTIARLDCTLENLAKTKKLNIDKLKSYGWQDRMQNNKPMIIIPYSDEEGNEVARRYRTSIKGKNKFRWRKGDKAYPYGLSHLKQFKDSEYLILVEGESDAVTLWYHGYPGLGLPGAKTYKEGYSSYLEQFQIIYVLKEPDRGGESFIKSFEASTIRDKVFVVTLSGANDVSELHCNEPDSFKKKFDESLKHSTKLTDIIEKRECLDRDEYYEQAKEIIHCKDIVEKLSKEISDTGYVGDLNPIKVIFLALTSRLLDKPISLIIKGQSSSGKSYSVEVVLKFFPQEAYYDISSMSEKALIYSKEPIKHRFIIIYESVGLGKEFATYIMRTLLSEHRIKYDTVVPTPIGPEPKSIIKEGPAGFVTTTTADKIYHDNETRLLSVEIEDTPEQTKRILKSLAIENQKSKTVNYQAWMAFQKWLSLSNKLVTIPFSMTLAEHVPPVATRLRRDFGQFLNFIRIHAIIHQKSRETDTNGAIIATIDDYEGVYNIVHELFSITLEQTVSKCVAQTVEAVRSLQIDEFDPISVRQLTKKLKLDQSTVRRRIYQALNRGFLHRSDEHKSRLVVVLGDPLPANKKLFPTPDELKIILKLNSNDRGEL